MWRTPLTGNKSFTPLVVITGPTAVGKTRFSLDIAEALNGEIVSADSRQIYRYMDVGTAKPTLEEQKRVPHHLIDVVDPDENLSLAQYVAQAKAAIDSIHHKKRLPLLVGGTAQYINALVEGWSIPEVPPNPELRAELEAYADEHGAIALYKRLQAVDTPATEKIEYQNVRRVVRALEVYYTTGKPISELQQKHPPTYAIRAYVFTTEREKLYQQADQRVEAMIDTGLLDEVRGLLENGYSPGIPAMSGIGYAQLIQHLQGDVTLAEAVEQTKIATHKFIRHQYTWFRKYNQSHLWHNVEEITSDDLIIDIQQWLKHQPRN
jgi:tRNA dimethylallyltransferase